MNTPVVLYHYTCSHSLKGIEESDWWLQPNPVAAEIGLWPLVWLTDLALPDKEALGLTSIISQCDRTEHRLIVRDADVLPWWRWARREKLSLAQRARLELAPGAQPLRWWVSPDPVRCEP